MCSASGLGLWLARPLRPAQAAVSKERLAAGEAIFHESGCVFCHGADLAGTDKAPNLHSVGRQKTRAQIEKQIREGGGGMPAFGEILADDQVAALLDFLGSQRKPVPKGQKPWGGTTPAVDKPAANPER